MTMINLALVTAEGLGKRLDPTLNLAEAALPYILEALRGAEVTQSSCSAGGAGL
jgi:predicted unusual protein kinase regulating ubiquinone biosynthesis (AarF/ABC1/UbiB family)